VENDFTKPLQAALDAMRISQTHAAGVYKYFNEFMLPFWTALNAFVTLERDKIARHHPIDTLRDYFELLQFNLQVAEKGVLASSRTMNSYYTDRASRAFSAWLDDLRNSGNGALMDFTRAEAQLLEKVVYSYPKAIWDIKPEYGFHFDSDGYEKVAETDRFRLYRVLPRADIDTRPDAKPILIIPPYVLGANILCFLPGERKSYVHAYADQGIPTYIRIIKPIESTPAVQTLTGEEDALDIRRFSQDIHRIHGRRVTLNGFCQGGFIALTALLTGELDGLVDALINCVAPMDGTRSKALVEYLRHLPPRFRDLGYALKELRSGNRVVDGKVMSWVYKLKSMETEAPLFTLYRDLQMLDRNGWPQKISKTAAAINYWLLYDRSDLPEPITKMSFDSYTIPIDSAGNLPVKLFGRPLNLNRLEQSGIRFMICYGAQDDLVDKAAALAPLDYVSAEVTEFPKGHGAIATSWSHPESEYALHKRFPNGSRGPVRFQLDLDAETTG
jgi:hypothetical protein